MSNNPDKSFISSSGEGKLLIPKLIVESDFIEPEASDKSKVVSDSTPGVLNRGLARFTCSGTLDRSVWDRVLSRLEIELYLSAIVKGVSVFCV